jgi:hypothetical protein
MPEKRVDPEDGTAYTYEELAAYYKGKYKRTAIDEYWESCKLQKGAKKADSKPKEKAKAKAKVKVKAKAKEPAEKKPVKLHYFPLKARGFPALLALEVGKVNYEAVVIPFDNWPEAKASGKYPFGYLAGLELADGTMINETNAILFTVGQLARLNGGSLKDFGISTMLACKAAEVFTEFTKVQPTIMTVKNWDGSKASALKEAEGKFNDYFEQFENLCSDDGKFTRSGKTTGELHLFSCLFHMKVSEFKTEFSPKLQKFYDRVAALDGVKKCCEEKSKFGEIANYVVPVPK